MSEAEDFVPVGHCVSDVITLKFSFTWTINKFSQRKEATGESLRSTVFEAPDARSSWYLELYPRGSNKHNAHCLGLFLNLEETSELQVRLYCRFTILGRDGQCDA